MKKTQWAYFTQDDHERHEPGMSGACKVCRKYMDDKLKNLAKSAAKTPKAGTKVQIVGEGKALFQCLECGKKFASAKAAEKAANDGCPKCGGTDIDIAESVGWSEVVTALDLLRESFGSRRSDYQDPGGKSALLRSSKKNPRNLPCPTCKQPNKLTPADKARGYQCDDCADRAEGGGW